jgi:hypothetical protein
LRQKQLDDGRIGGKTNEECFLVEHIMDVKGFWN